MEKARARCRNPTPQEDVVAKETPVDEYELNYSTLNCIGKGAFGFVKLATRKSDQQEVRVKAGVNINNQVT